MNLFDVALDKKVEMVGRVSIMADWLKTQETLIPDRERDILTLPVRLARMPIAIVTSEIVEIARTFPETATTTDISPLIEHFVYLEDSLPINEQHTFRSFYTQRTDRGILMVPLADQDVPGSGLFMRLSEQDRAPIAGIMELSTQYLEQERLSRPERRRARRAFPAADPVSDTVVLRLRREEHRQPSGESRSVDWSHRWLVQGHWRRLRDRTTWVRQHVKGPPDRPLVLKDRRIRFDR